MTVYKIRGVDTDVSRSDCGRRECFSLGHDRGPYVQGRGYTGTGTGQARCLTRDVHGCPSNSVCTKCKTSSPLHVTELDGACDRRHCDGDRVDMDGNPAPDQAGEFKPLVFSIHRDHVKKFRSGEKGVEFRTRAPKVEAGELVLIYETAPTQMIVAVATVGKIHKGTPANIWERFGHVGGIAHWRFNSYFSKRDRATGVMKPRDLAVAIELEPTWLAMPKPLWPSMPPPQSWSRWKGPWPMPSWGTTSPARG
jgi:predicted transcriptional regulator